MTERTNNNVIVTEDVAKEYSDHGVPVRAVRGVSLSIANGEFTAIVGPSGSGKTTFLNIAGLLESFEHGTYMLDGEDVSGLGDDERSIYRNQKIGLFSRALT